MTDFNFAARDYDFVSYVDCKNWIGVQWGDAQRVKTIEVDKPRHKKTMGQIDFLPNINHSKENLEYYHQHYPMQSMNLRINLNTKC